MKKIFLTVSLFLAVVSAGVMFVPRTAFADTPADEPAKCDTSSSILGLPTWYKYLDVGKETDGNGAVVKNCAIIGPRKTDAQRAELDIPAVIGLVALAIVEILLRIGGLVAVVFVLMGGFKYITSQGEPEKTKSARMTIINAMIGLMIAIMATALVAFVGREFTK